MLICCECGFASQDAEAFEECLECADDVCQDCYDLFYEDEEDETPDERKKQLLCTHSYALLPHGEHVAWVSWGADGRYQRCQKCGEVRKTPAPQEVSA